MTISRRTVLTGIGATAIAAALPPVVLKVEPLNLTATQVNARIAERLTVYGRDPAMCALPSVEELNALMAQFRSIGAAMD